MSRDERIVGASAERVLRVVEQMMDLPWPEGDEWTEWTLDGLEGQTSWMMHVLPLASRAEPREIEVLAARLTRLAGRRWGKPHTFHATRYTDDATTKPTEYDRRSAPAGLVRSLGATTAAWWRHAGHAVLLVDSSATQPHDTKLVVLVMSASWLGKPGKEEDALRTPVVESLLSGDPSRILSAVWEVMATRDPRVLEPLETALPAIRRGTADVELGGALASNAAHLAAALERVEIFGAGTCLCTAYPGHQFYDPDKEQQREHVRVVGTVPNERQWVPDRICECVDCGRRYQVEQGEYHYPWWRWTPLTS